MSDREKEILELMAEAISNMSEFDKGYFLAKAEDRVAEKRERELQEA